MKRLLFILFLFCLSGFQLIVKADNRCSHAIRIKIISNNKFYVKKNQELSKSEDIQTRNKSNNITLKWYFSSKAKKISVSSDKVNKLCSVQLIRKDQNTDGKIINITSKSRELINSDNNNSGECRINYKVASDKGSKEDNDLNVIYTVTDKF